MSWDIAVPFFVSLVFLDVVKVVPSDDNGPYHFCTMASTGKDTASNRNSASKWAFLINICSFNGLSGCLKA